MKIKAIIALLWVDMAILTFSCFNGSQTKVAGVPNTPEMYIPTVESPRPTPLEAHSTVSPTPIATLHPREQSVQEMLAIVDVVKTYYEDYGEYPNSINDLIPKYLAEIPITNEGFEIRYDLWNDSIFRVRFEPNPRGYCSYLSSEDAWECGFMPLVPIP